MVAYRDLDSLRAELSAKQEAIDARLADFRRIGHGTDEQLFEELCFAILAIHTKGMNLDKAVNLKEVSRATEGKNGADLKAICTEAGMFAIRSDRTTVTQPDFMAAIEKASTDFNKHQLTTSYGAMFA